MKKNLVAEQWAQFMERVMPLDAPEIQKTEMKRAFYAGAQALFFRVIAAFAPEDEPTMEDMKVMEDLDRELQEFAQAVKEGRA